MEVDALNCVASPGGTSQAYVGIATARMKLTIRGLAATRHIARRRFRTLLRVDHQEGENHMLHVSGR